MAKPRGGVVLLDGPCAGRYSVRRAPIYLRAVSSLARDTTDLLDQLADEPMRDETVHVYEGVPGTLFDPDTWARTRFAIICPPPGASGEYRHRPDVDGEALRTTVAWRAWARAQPVPAGTVDGATLEPVRG